MPTVQDISINSNGKITPSVTYNEVGTTLRVQGNWEGEGPDPSAHVRCQIELSSIGKTGIKLASGVQLPEFRQFKIDQEMVLKHGTPVVLLSNSQPSPPYVSPETESQAAASSPRCTATLTRITAWKLGTAKPAE